jgi:hypothetical protein
MYHKIDQENLQTLLSVQPTDLLGISRRAGASLLGSCIQVEACHCDFKCSSASWLRAPLLLMVSGRRSRE